MTTAASPLTVAIHVPKTGGVTLRQGLTAVMDGDVVVAHEPTLAAWRRRHELDERLKAAAALSGHFRFGVDRWLKRPCLYVTLLRDPTARIVSHWRWACRHPESPLHADAVALGLRGYVESGRAHELVANGQVRLLGGTLGAAVRPATTATLRRALARLDELAAVGLIERWRESARLIAAAVGCPVLPGDLRANAAPPHEAPPDLDARTRRSIERRNTLDSELVAAVAARLDAEGAAA